jgi:hypothetical protein
LVTVIGFGVVMALFGAAWALDLAIRPVCNQHELDKAYAFRSRQKLHTDKEYPGGRQLWPLDTNLCSQVVAGPGMLLHFNFQAAVMIWGLWGGTVWVLFALIIDSDLFILGTRKFGTPRENCILVAWGYETQQRLMWTKVWYCIVMYISSFIFCMLHGVRQLRLFNAIDAKTKTMKDFVCMIVGIPENKGDDKQLESKVAECVSKYADVPVVGVSVCWNWKESEDVCMKALNLDLRGREEERKKTKDAEKKAAGEAIVEHEKPEVIEERILASYSARRRWYHNMEKQVAEDDDDDELPNMEELLTNMENTEDAFVIFETEEDRDKALKKFEETGGLMFDGNECQLVSMTCEPDTVQWVNFGHSTPTQRAMRLVMGLGYMFLGLTFWALVFYAPYAWSVMSFNYDNGAQPPPVFALVFTMVVVCGNAIMYEICARVADFVGFKYRDHRESCYIVLYTVACMLNVLLDMYCTYRIAWWVCEGQGFRTYHGRSFKGDDWTFTEKFETYAMQRVLAENTYAYSFPATFLIPFLIEPFITIYFPLKLGEFMVRTHPMITGRTAEEWLMAFEMDMGRYADILLDCVLVIIIFYFPGGYTYQLFYAMVFSHVVIYCFDHWRVVSTIPACCYASMDVDWAAQAMFAPCTATIMSCLIFKANCQGYGYCFQGWTIVEVCSVGWTVACALHLACLIFVVPVLGKSGDDGDDPNADKKFQEICEDVACSWFTSNPIHCLRSKYVHKHSPPCSFWVSGKEHLQDKNTAINCYFETEEAEAEDFSKADLGLASLSKRFTDKFKKKAEEKPEEDK